MDQETNAQLKKIDWFTELPDEMLDALAKKVHKRNLSKDEYLFHKGDQAIPSSS